MSGFIEDFYYGDICPQEELNKTDPILDTLNLSLKEMENNLIKNLQGEAEEIFKKYIKLSQHRSEVLKCKAYTNGFRTGSQFTYDAFFND